MTLRRIAAPALAAVAALWAASTFLGVFDLTKFQWDFRTYYFAVKVFAAGGDPYAVEAVARAATVPITLPFVYPPTALYFFKIFSFLSFEHSAHLYVLCKFAAFGALIWLWRKFFVRERAGLLFVVVAALAFDQSLYADFASGNPALFETLFLWIGFACFMKKDLAGFCVCVLAASFIKIQPILLLPLVFTVKHKRRTAIFAVSAAVFVGVFASFAIFEPQLWRGFVRNIAESNTSILLFENGRINPSSFAFLEHLFWLFRLATGADMPVWLRALTHEAFIVLVLWAAGRALFRSYRRSPEPTPDRLYLYLLTYALILPRFKDYSYSLLIVPAWEAVRRLGTRHDNRPIWIAVLVLTATSPVRAALPAIRVFWEYYPFILAFGMWCFYLNEINSDTADV